MTATFRFICRQFSKFHMKIIFSEKKENKTKSVGRNRIIAVLIQHIASVAARAKIKTKMKMHFSALLLKCEIQKMKSQIDNEWCLPNAVEESVLFGFRQCQSS